MTPFNLKKYLKETEEFWIATALAESAGNKKRAAALLGMKRTCLVGKMKLFGMPLREPYRKKKEHHEHKLQQEA